MIDTFCVFCPLMAHLPVSPKKNPNISLLGISLHWCSFMCFNEENDLKDQDISVKSILLFLNQFRCVTFSFMRIELILFLKSNIRRIWIKLSVDMNSYWVRIIITILKRLLLSSNLFPIMELSSFHLLIFNK
jgi:hypothetical protein